MQIWFFKTFLSLFTKKVWLSKLGKNNFDKYSHSRNKIHLSSNLENYMNISIFLKIECKLFIYFIFLNRFWWFWNIYIYYNQVFYWYCIFQGFYPMFIVYSWKFFSKKNWFREHTYANSCWLSKVKFHFIAWKWNNVSNSKVLVLSE